MALLPGAACPRCGAGVRPAAPWCTQCWLDLSRPTAPPTPTPVVSGSPPAPAPPRPAGRHAAPSAVEVAEGWPCATCGTVADWDRSSCPGCGAGFLAELRAGAAPLLVLPGVGDVARLDRGQRLGLAAAVVLVALLLVAVLTALS